MRAKLGKPFQSVQSFLFLALLMVTACRQPSTFKPTFTDTYVNHIADRYDQANALLQADYLFVLDTSFSMQDENTELANALSSFSQYLADEAIDFRAGFVSANVHGNWVAPCIQNGWPSSCFALSFMGGNYFSQSTSSTTFDSIVAAVGAPLAPNHVFALETADRAATSLESFLRPAAQLVYVFVAGDDDEFTTRTPASYVSSLKAKKSNPAYVSSRAFVYTDGTCEPSGGYQNGEGAAPRIAEVSEALDALNEPAACLADPNAELLEDLARNVTRPTDRFKLIGVPVQGTLKVFVDEAERTHGFSYLAASNEVVFDAGAEPAFSSRLRFEYEVAFVLTNKPRLETVAVTINGATVNASDSNGWSYLAAENRIVFNGSAKPADGADVKISYEIQ